jgi:hypothetical protein
VILFGGNNTVTKVPVNHFDRAKPFYPLVMNYLVLLIGFKELALRGLTAAQSLDQLAGRISALAPATATPEQVEAVRAGLRKLSGPLELRSEYQGGHIAVDVDELAREIIDNHGYLLGSTIRAGGSLLVLAHEISKGMPWHGVDPLWEFLRHCRNAAAHGGAFRLVAGEPKRPAVWGQIEITRKVQNMPLFRDASGGGLLSPGDPIRLLWDLEQAHPEMAA